MWENGEKIFAGFGIEKVLKKKLARSVSESCSIRERFGGNQEGKTSRQGISIASEDSTWSKEKGRRL